MNLEQLLERGGYIQSGYETRSVTWESDTGEVTFDVTIKREMSAADHEFVYLGIGAEPQDASIAARRVHRMVRILGDKKEPEQIPLPVAAQMKPTLLQAICAVVNEVETPQETKEEAEKNSARPPKSSGMNSSRPASEGARLPKLKSA